MLVLIFLCRALVTVVDKVADAGRTDLLKSYIEVCIVSSYTSCYYVDLTQKLSAPAHCTI